jgi:hypothetical protein
MSKSGSDEEQLHSVGLDFEDWLVQNWAVIYHAWPHWLGIKLLFECVTSLFPSSLLRRV